MSTAVLEAYEPDIADVGAIEALVSVRPYLVTGYAALAFLAFGIGGWLVLTDLAGAVVAPGTIVAATNVKKIQHPTGGVVGAIFVKNGDHVKAGDVLLRLDETVTRASLQLITKQLDELVGQQARLVAERDDAQNVQFPDGLVRRGTEPSVADILSGEQTLFEKRISTQRAQANELSERISGLREEIAGTEGQVAAKSKEIGLIGEELKSLEGLEAQQLVPTSKMMALRREGARLEGERAALVAGIGQSKQKIAEIEVQRLAMQGQFKSDSVKDLRDVQGRIAELSERRTAAEDQLQRIALKSPVTGVVDQLSMFTVGGVINPGETAMVVMPDADRRVIEAKIRPQDIEGARKDATAIVRLTAFDQRTTPTIEGVVTTVAADVTREPQTGAMYFLARIEIPDAELRKLGDHVLVAGMPAEVQIKTSSRTALSYFLKPLMDQFAKAFKER
jgi:HlyD family secretion protein